ncbi:hypothetical protein HDU91_003583, partial [Kappamyces sp. JEL0680]
MEQSLTNKMELLHHLSREISKLSRLDSAELKIELEQRLRKPVVSPSLLVAGPENGDHPDWEGEAMSLIRVQSLYCRCVVNVLKEYHANDGLESLVGLRDEKMIDALLGLVVCWALAPLLPESCFCLLFALYSDKAFLLETGKFCLDTIFLFLRDKEYRTDAVLSGWKKTCTELILRRHFHEVVLVVVGLESGRHDAAGSVLEIALPELLKFGDLYVHCRLGDVLGGLTKGFSKPAALDPALRKRGAFYLSWLLMDPGYAPEELGFDSGPDTAKDCLRTVRPLLNQRSQ